ncbi:hypothetical protein HKX48_003806 [Thoreauomyces humboldtii]|nr:hypothetical protein HKX48_003806 [Thoreauomyces humboldtii]
MLSHLSQAKGAAQGVDEDGRRISRKDVHPPLAGNSRHSLNNPAAPEPEKSTRPRLMISKMVLKNFKSYAGIVEIGPFHKSFTSIVGPNGSGKSNVIDSLLFVFGFKAKKMRQGKLSELIHNSTHHQNLTSCSVEVHFQEIVDLPGPDAFEVVPSSGLVVSRTVERGPSEKSPDKSLYRINGRSSTFTEVTTLLKNKGVDLDHKRFLILQGEVESIALMKPKAQNEHEDGLLEYLEDIIGTSSYKEQIDRASAELDTMNEERTEKLNRLKFVEKDKNALESKKSEAEEFIQTENAVTLRKNQLYRLSIFECGTEIREKEEEAKTLSDRLEAERGKYGDILAEVKTLERQHKSVQKEQSAIAAEAQAVQEELSRYDRTEVETREKESHLQKKQKKLSTAIHKESLERSEHETWIQNFESDMEKATAEAEDLSVKLAAEEKALEEIQESLKGKTEKFQKAIERKQEELGPWMEKINAEQAGLDVAQSECQILDDKIASAKALSRDAEQRVVEMRAQYREKKQQLVSLQASRDDVRKRAEETSGDIELHAKNEEKLRSKVAKSRSNADDAKVTLQAAQTRGKLHASIMQQSATGRIHGICGRLGDLGVIDDKYDVAVTTACGSLDAIVVETVEAGQKCIEHLRKQSLGRATFICLDRLTKWDTSPVRTPADAPRLFDLIKPKHARYAPAFYQGLRDTLVALDLKEAEQLSYGQSKRYRVVTLDGQLIDVSGTMSGGGKKVQRGGMSSKFASDAGSMTAAQVTKLEEDRNLAEAELKGATRAKEECQEMVEQLRKEVTTLDLDVEKLAMDVKSLEASLKDAEAHAETLRRRRAGPSAEEVSRRDELETVVTKAQSRLSSLQTSASSIESDITALQEKVLEAGGVKLRTQRARVDGIQEGISASDARLTKLRVERTAREKALGKVVKSLDKNSAELEKAQADVQDLKDVLAGQREAAERVTAKVKDALGVLADKEEELESIKVQLDERTDMANELRKFEVEVKAELEAAQKIVSQKISQRMYYEKEIATKLQLQLTGFEEEEASTDLPDFTDEELKEVDKRMIAEEMKNLQDKLDKGTPNLSVLADYKQKQEAYLSRVKDLEKSTALRDAAKQSLDALSGRRLTEFMTGFAKISDKLKEMYQMITLGGNAELELVDSLDPFSEGILFSVMPPKKSWKNISNLSGGEKTLSSLALVFALHHFKPTPLYVMDEIDAALDFRNVSIVANYIKERTKDAQFVIISLRNDMFELADRLVGIYKTDNTTKSITIDPAAVANN